MGAAPPQWLAQFMAVPPLWMAQFIGNVDQNFNQMQAGFARIEARQVNVGISRLNRLEMENNSGLIAYRAKQKVVSRLFEIISLS